jgi:hypothetical protein
MNPIHTPRTYFPKIHFNIILYLSLSVQSDLFPLGLPSGILYTFLIAYMRATYPAHLIVLDLIILISAEEYKF